jgi:hypothetical protein
MSQTYAGKLALICPDCQTHLVNVAPSGERYHCHDCDLRLMRDGDEFLMFRFGETVGTLAIEEVEISVTWQTQELAHAS